jgi:hypothetical protein
MSALETEVKPAVVALIGDQSMPISRGSVASLSRWVAVKTMVAEHSTEDAALTPPEDRRAVRTGVIPSYFRIFAALHTLETKTAYYRQSTTLSRSIRGPEPPLPDGISRNVQVTAFLLGPVFFYITAARIAFFNADILDPVHAMYRLWPEPANGTIVQPLPPLESLQVAAISQSLDRLVQDPRVWYGGPRRRSTRYKPGTLVTE